MAGDWREKLKGLALQVCERHSLELYELEFLQTGKRWLVRATLDSAERPITLIDCETVSRDLSALIDLEDVVPHAFTLEVSSPGLERKLRTVKDFARFKGEKANVVYDSISEDVPHGFVEGVIVEASEEKVVIGSGQDKVMEIPFNKIKRARLVFEFSK